MERFTFSFSSSRVWNTASEGRKGGKEPDGREKEGRGGGVKGREGDAECTVE